MDRLGDRMADAARVSAFAAHSGDPAVSTSTSTSACRFKIVATTDTSIRRFEGTAVAKPGQRATLDELLIALVSGIVREEKLTILGLTIEASMESPNTPEVQP